jgi:hypothetical protein
MKTKRPWGRIIITVLIAALILVGVGFAAYQFGFQRGLMTAGAGEFGLSGQPFSGDGQQPQFVRGNGGPGLGFFQLPWLIGGGVVIGLLILLAIGLSRSPSSKKASDQ